MIDALISLIEDGKWEEARTMADSLSDQLKNSDTFWILNAAIAAAEGNAELEYTCITRGLQQNPENYELYFMLGNYLMPKNSNQAFLCYEYALYFCNDEADRQMITENMNAAENSVHPVSIIIVAQNDAEKLRECIDSIRSTVRSDACEIIVLDYDTDEEDTETCALLREQEEIRFIRCPDIHDYIAARNYAIKSASPGNDVFLLANDAVLAPGTLFRLRMGLYERDSIGAVGPMTNKGDKRQVIGCKFGSKEEYFEYARQMHMSSANPYENKIYLSGFALLIRRKALDETGLFDGDYGTIYFSDCDFGMKVAAAGYELLLCHNSFVYYYNCLNNLQGINTPLKRDEKFYDKWGFQVTYYFTSRDELIDFIDSERDAAIHVLEVGCGCGATLSKIKYLYPNSQVYGIELSEDVARMGRFMGDIIAGDVENMEFPYAYGTFDYIIFGDVLEHLHAPDKLLTELRSYLKPTGRLIASIPNLMHISVIVDLLRGFFPYSDSGLLDRTHIHFFTQYEILRLFEQCGYQITKMQRFIIDTLDTAEQIELANAVYSLPHVAEQAQFETYQYYLTAERML